MHLQMKQMPKSGLVELICEQLLHLFQSSFMVIYIIELTCLVKLRFATEGLEWMHEEEVSYFLGTGPGLLIKSFSKYLESILWLNNMFFIF